MDVPAKLGIPDYEFRLIFGRTKIDYDPNKESHNRSKHSYSLESAVHILEQIMLPVDRVPPYMVSEAYMEKEEVRHMHMSIDDCGHVVLMVTTMRQDETVRVISVRRAHENERQLFHQVTGYIRK